MRDMQIHNLHFFVVCLCIVEKKRVCSGVTYRVEPKVTRHSLLSRVVFSLHIWEYNYQGLRLGLRRLDAKAFETCLTNKISYVLQECSVGTVLGIKWQMEASQGTAGKHGTPCNTGIL